MQRNLNPAETPASSLASSSASMLRSGPTPEELSMPTCSLSRASLQQLCALRRDQFSLFSRLPNDIIQLIGEIHYDPCSESEIAKLLLNVAYADVDNIKIIKSMLDDNPGLLLWASDTIDPANNNIRRVTPYQLALLAGDDYLANIIAPYFERLGSHGNTARATQYAECKAYIDTMMSQPAYDFSSLIKHVKDASMESVQAALDCHFDNERDSLHAALAKFRQDFAPRTITEGMHFNYNNLLQAFREFAALSDKLGNNPKINQAKSDLFWRQIVGFIQRSLPSCDLQAFAQGTYYITESNEQITRRFDLRFANNLSSADDDSKPFNELGYKYALGGGPDNSTCFTWATCSSFDTFCQRKLSDLQNLYSAYNVSQSARAGV